jgi:hypothetical protein
MGDGWLSPAKVKTLHKAVVDACDEFMLVSIIVPDGVPSDFQS